MDLTYISRLLHEFGFPGDKVLKVSTASWVPHSTCGVGCWGLLILLFEVYLLLLSLPLRKSPALCLSSSATASSTDTTQSLQLRPLTSSSFLYLFKLARKIDNVETSWALGAIFHYIDSLKRQKVPAL